MITAFIPVRGGSKSIPLKNIKPLNGKPLIYWSLVALENTAYVDEIIVATDSEEITKTVLDFNFLKTKIYKRKAENATDTATTESVMLEYIEQSELKDDDIFMLVQATSPLTQTEHFSGALELYKQNKYDSLLSCVRNYRFFWNEDGTSINYDYKARPRRQDFKGQLMENGAFYINKVGNIKLDKNRLCGNIGIYEMPEYTAIELDSPNDWIIVEQIAETLIFPPPPHYQKYGKDINMRSLKRDLRKIEDLISLNVDFCKENLKPIDSSAEVECRICQSKKNRHFIDIRGYQYNLCENCESIILVNLPDVKALYATKETKASAVYLDDDAFIKRVESIALPKVEFVSSLLDIKQKKIWCDIGCGVGEILMALKDAKYADNFQGIGIEIDPEEIKFGLEKELNIIEGYLNPEEINDEIANVLSTSDIVSMFNTLEHIEQPAELMKVYKKYMKKGAYLVIEVPRHPSLSSFANLTNPDLTYRHIVPPIHLQIFSEKAIKMLLGNDFSLLASWDFGQGFTDILTNAMLFNNTKEDVLYQDLMNISNKVQETIDRSGFSDQMIFVMQKNQY